MKKSHTVLSLLLLTAAVAGYFAFRSPDKLDRLKATAEVSGDANGMFKLVGEIAAAARSGDARKRLAPFMLVNDRTEVERITEPLCSGPELGELKFLGCTKLEKSSRENLGVHVYSVGRKRSYAFYFLKDAGGEYKLSDIGLSKRKP